MATRRGSKYAPWLAKRPLFRRFFCLGLLTFTPLIMLYLVIDEHKFEIWEGIKEVAQGIIDDDNS